MADSSRIPKVLRVRGLLRGTTVGITNGQTLFDQPASFVYLGSAQWAGVPASIWVAGALCAVAILTLRYHRIGRAIYAVGGSTRFGIGPRLPRAVVHGDTVHLTGCIVERTAGESVREQTREILATIDRILAEAGSDKTRILPAQIHLARIATYGEMNDEWDAWTPEGHTPARATFESRLPQTAIRPA